MHGMLQNTRRVRSQDPRWGFYQVVITPLVRPLLRVLSIAVPSTSLNNRILSTDKVSFVFAVHHLRS
jgi:hypothetical protein